MTFYSRFGRNISSYGITTDGIDQDSLSRESETLSTAEKSQIIYAFKTCKNRFNFQTPICENGIEFVSSLFESRMSRMSLSFDDCIVSIYESLFANYMHWIRDKSEMFANDDDPEGKLYRIVLFVAIWSEAANLRYCPELLCFIFQLCLDTKATIPSFLVDIVTPFFTFLRDQIYKQHGASPTLSRRFRDHTEIIGYDDMTEAFWTRQGLQKLILKSGEKIMELPTEERLQRIKDLDLQRSFGKTFYERRTPLHVFVNFLPVWLIHVSLFFYYVTISLKIDNLVTHLLVAGFGGILSSLFCLVSLLLELLFIPMSSPMMRGVFYASVKLVGLMLLNVSIPSVMFLFKIKYSISLPLAFCQCFLSVSTTLLCLWNPRMRSNTDPHGQIKASSVHERKISWIFWAIVLTLKSITSFFYIILPFSKPLQRFMTSFFDCTDLLCTGVASSAIFWLIMLNAILFLLDSYVWYIIVMTVFGVYEAQKSGISIFTPWKQGLDNLLQKLETHMLNAVDSTHEKGAKIWNAIVKSWFSDSILSKTQMELISAKQDETGKYHVPAMEGVVSIGPEAIRRLSFLSQTLSTILPPPCQPAKIPTFTVLIPHYAEKIILSLRDLIHDYDGRDSFISLLDYLKLIYNDEWENFVSSMRPASSHARQTSQSAMGFSAKEELFRTRLWASIHAQTLYRTVSGFHQYQNALDMHAEFSGMPLLNRFRMLVAVQRYAEMSADELENVEFMLSSFPELCISFVERSEEGKFYSCLITPDSPLLAETGRRIPLFQIELPGNPYLGDGKSDNQNHSVVFSRGEILQLIDANQDNYLEEALKIPCILTEMLKEDYAIVGSREYIFSKGIGVLGDVAAGKEYTFGTITQRVLSKLNSRLHYGHPDFLNSLFVITRGGVSKGQRGLHLNEDIFAGMNVILRGGIIKHVEYTQCGKGRDLGFTSIMSFVSKIGSGMGEQMLTREQYYLGRLLPLDRLLTFYFAHPGFHLNNLCSMVSIRLFVLTMMLAATLSHLTSFDTDELSNWITSSTSAMFIVMMISFIPWFFQIMTEFGLVHALKRLSMHIICLTPLFEVFTTQIYAHSLSQIGWASGGTGYSATGRGFSTYRQPFAHLFGNYLHSSIRFGTFLMLQLLFLSTTSLSRPFIIFFWFIVCALTLPPFVFNPKQFDYGDFIIDYYSTLQWFFCGNIDDGSYQRSWIMYFHHWRATITGSSRLSGGRRSHFLTMFQRLFVLFMQAIFPVLIYFSYSTRGLLQTFIALLVLPFGHLGLGLVFSLIFFIISFFSSVFIWCLPETVSKNTGRFLASTFRIFSIFTLLGLILAIIVMESFSLTKISLNLYSYMVVSEFYQTLIYITFISRDNSPKIANFLFWTAIVGQDETLSAFRRLLILLREVVCKALEFQQFGIDFLIAHLLVFCMFPLTWLPILDKVHAKMMLWNTNSENHLTLLHECKTLTMTQQRVRKRNVIICSMCLLFQLSMIIGVIALSAIGLFADVVPPISLL